jgi:hypothetical protein
MSHVGLSAREFRRRFRYTRVEPSSRGEEILDELDRRIDAEPERHPAGEFEIREYPRRPHELHGEQEERITRELAAIDPKWRKHLSLDWLSDE